MISRIPAPHALSAVSDPLPASPCWPPTA